jgi:hypothetical protein
MSILVFWVVTPYWLLGGHQLCGDISCVWLQGFSEAAVCVSMSRRGISTQNKNFGIFTAARNSNFTSDECVMMIIMMVIMLRQWSYSLKCTVMLLGSSKFHILKLECHIEAQLNFLWKIVFLGYRKQASQLMHASASFRATDLCKFRFMVINRS